MAVAEPLHFTDEMRVALIIDIRKADLNLSMLAATYNLIPELIVEVGQQEGMNMSVREELVGLRATRLRLDRQIEQLLIKFNWNS
jgi:hypothetical protein